MKHRGERRAGVLRVSVDPPRQQRLLTDVGAREKKPPFHVQSGLRFEILRQHLAKDHLFGKILTPDHECPLPPGAAAREAEGCKQEAESNREKKPRRDNAPAHADTPC